MEALLMGIDLGTSSVKACIVDTGGRLYAQGGCGYQFDVPRQGYAEQDPEVWWNAAKQAIRQAVQGLREGQERQIKGIGFSGQMHGLVCMDRNGLPLRPAILHCDQRTGAEIEEIYEKVSEEEVNRIVLNRLCTGFLLPSLYWVKKNEPEVYRRIDTVLLPKDYIRYRMTGVVGTDFSDASATGAFDVIQQCWSQELFDKLELDSQMFPECRQSAEVAGTLRTETARELGLPENIAVVYGGGDQPVQALGNGAIREGMAISNIGTSGQIFICQSQPLWNPEMNTNLFCHVIPDSWYSSGAIMSGGAALSWMMNKVLQKTDYEQLNLEMEQVAPGSEGVIFLPYLMGERTPHLNPDAKGMFFGLSINHDAAHMTHAVMEGVCFALRDCLMTLEAHGCKCGKWVIASGGAAKSRVWRQLQADILGKEIVITGASEHGCLGAAILAGIGCGIFADAGEACREMVQLEDTVVCPNPEHEGIYGRIYETYRKLYENNKELF